MLFREHFNGMYRTDAYFLAKQFVEMPLFVLDGVIIFTSIYWMAGLNPGVDRFFIALGIIALILQVSIFISDGVIESLMKTIIVSDRSMKTILTSDWSTLISGCLQSWLLPLLYLSRC